MKRNKKYSTCKTTSTNSCIYSLTHAQTHIHTRGKDKESDQIKEDIATEKERRQYVTANFFSQSVFDDLYIAERLLLARKVNPRRRD